MKKYFALLLVFSLLVLIGCSSQSTKNGSQTTADIDESAAIEPSEMTGMPKQKTTSGDVVIYFSATGTTANIAQTMAQVLDAPIYEIIPKVPYSADDLNYGNDNCRANKEMNDDSVRPEISSDLSEVMDSNTIYLGYPIWWGTAPKVINTFLESYDLSGKKIYTFCTSGSSGIEHSISDLQSLYTNINIVSGHRFSSGASEEDIQSWIDSLGTEE